MRLFEEVVASLSHFKRPENREPPFGRKKTVRSDSVNQAESRTYSARAVASCVALCFLALCLALITGLPSCSQKRVEETVTVDAARSSAAAAKANAQPVAIAPQLPARDADLELAGDRVAEAITHLKKRQNAAALGALAQSRVAINRALRNESRDAEGLEALRATLKGIESAEHSIQRGALGEAATQLVALNKKVDAIGTRPAINANAQP